MAENDYALWYRDDNAVPNTDLLFPGGQDIRGDDAKIGGMTPDVFSFSGRKDVWPS